MSSGTLDSQVEPGFSKGEAYDKHRATYAADAVDILLENLQVDGKKNARILDLAAGTGTFTDALSVREEQYAISAVEPLESMRRVLANKGLPSVEVKDGRADSIPVDDAVMDAVVVAQAFHWFASLDALREIHRVLQRHGALGMIWNVEDWNAPQDHDASTPWEAKIRDLLWSIKTDDDAPRYRDMQWQKVFDEQVKKTPLSLIIASDDQLFALPIGQRQLEWEIKLSKEGAWDRFSTLSQVAVLEREEKERMRIAFMDAINDAETDENWQVTVHGYTHLAWTTKIPAEGHSASTDMEETGAK